MSDQDELMLGYLEDQLNDTEFAEFVERLNDARFRERVALFAFDQAAIYELARTESATPFVAIGRPWTVTLAQYALAAVVLIAFVGVGWHQLATWNQRALQVAESPTVSSPTVPFAEVTSVSGHVTADEKDVHAGAALVSGQTIKTKEIESAVEIAFADGTRISVVGEAVLKLSEIDGQKRIEASTANLWASVQPQPQGKPLIVITPKAVLEVLGTELVVTANSDATTLLVNEGRVSMRRLDDGVDVEVQSQQMATTATSGQMQSTTSPKLSDTWEADFDKQLPDGWQRGTRRLVDVNNQTRPVLLASNSGSDHHSIMTHNAYLEGLFEIHPDSYLNYRVRMENPGFYQVLIGVRRDDYAPPARNYEFQQTSSQEKALGTWTTVSVPIASFKQNNPSTRFQDDQWPVFADRNGQPPPVGEVPYFILFSTQGQDRGMMIERIWVTRGAPGESL